jgi:hypothetical protein
MKEIITSKFLSLNGRDFIKGLLLAGVCAALDAVLECLKAGKLIIDWSQVGTVAGIAMAGYLKIKLFTPAKAIAPVEQP